MQEVAFSIPVSGIISINENSITITVNSAETSIKFKPAPEEEQRVALPKGMTVFDVLLETARQYVRSSGQSRFSAADLYHEAIRRYPGLKRNTWTAHVIASAPNHPSYRHHSSKRDFFKYVGRGAYNLELKYHNGGDTNGQEDKDEG